MSEKPKIPDGWSELPPLTVIETDDKIWTWNNGPWVYVGGSIIGERYGRATADTNRHWTIIRENKPQLPASPTMDGPESWRYGERA